MINRQKIIDDLMLSRKCNEQGYAMQHYGQDIHGITGETLDAVIALIQHETTLADRAIEQLVDCELNTPCDSLLDDDNDPSWCELHCGKKAGPTAECWERYLMGGEYDD